MGTRMVRKQICIPQEQEAMLRELARRDHCSEADIVRRSLAEVFARRLPAGLSRDEAWQRQLAIMDEQAAHKLPPSPRTWTREELYEERLLRRYQRAGLPVRPEGAD